MIQYETGRSTCKYDDDTARGVSVCVVVAVSDDEDEEGLAGYCGIQLLALLDEREWEDGKDVARGSLLSSRVWRQIKLGRGVRYSAVYWF